MRIARLEANTQIQSQMIALLTDPVWSTIGGFVVIHELRKANMIGPVADDVLYAGLIANNPARPPGLVDRGGRVLPAATSLALPAAAAAGGAAAGGAAAGGAAAGGAAAGGAAAGVTTLAKGGAVALGGAATTAALMKAQEYLMTKEQRKEWKKQPLWRRVLMSELGLPGTQGISRRVGNLVGSLFKRKKRRK